jgi:hypothetical protein
VADIDQRAIKIGLEWRFVSRALTALNNPLGNYT